MLTANSGALIEAARAAKGWTASRLARETGMTNVFLRAIEQGKQPLPRWRALTFSRVLGIPLNKLVEPDPATLALVEARLVAAGRCDRAVRIVRAMGGGGA